MSNKDKNEDDILSEGMSPERINISPIILTTENMLTNTLKNDEEGFYLIDYNKIKDDKDKDAIKNHLLEMQKIEKELFNKCDIMVKDYLTDSSKTNSKYISSPTDDLKYYKVFFLFYNGYLISYKKCNFKDGDGYILCQPFWTCSFTKILKKHKIIGYEKKSSVVVILEKIKECFKDKHFYFPIFLHCSEESLNTFLKNDFKIVLIDYTRKDTESFLECKTKNILLPTEINLKNFLEKEENKSIDKYQYLLKRIFAEKTIKNLSGMLLPENSSFFSKFKTPNLNLDLVLSYPIEPCFLIYVIEKTTDGKKRKSKKKPSKRKKSKKRRKSRN